MKKDPIIYGARKFIWINKSTNLKKRETSEDNHIIYLQNHPQYGTFRVFLEATKTVLIY